MSVPSPRSSSLELVFFPAPGVSLEQTCARPHPVVSMGSYGEVTDAGQC